MRSRCAISAYGMRQSVFAHVHRGAPVTAFLAPLFAADRAVSLKVAGVAVRVAVPPSAWHSLAILPPEAGYQFFPCSKRLQPASLPRSVPAPPDEALYSGRCQQGCQAIRHVLF